MPSRPDARFSIENLASGDGIANGLGQLGLQSSSRMAQAAPGIRCGRPATTWLAFRQRMPGVSSLRHSGMSLVDVQLMGGIFHQVPAEEDPASGDGTRMASSFTEPSVKGADRDDTKGRGHLKEPSPDARFSTKISRRVTA